MLRFPHPWCLQNAKQGVGGASWSNTWGSHSKVAGAAGEQLHIMFQLGPHARLWLFCTWVPCEKIRISMSFTLPVCPFLFLSACSRPPAGHVWSSRSWISQSIQSWSRAQPTRGLAQAVLCRNGIQPLPGQVDPQSSSLNWCGLAETKLCQLPFNQGECSSGDFEGFGKEERAQPMISLLWSYIFTLRGFASYDAKQAKECDLDGLRAAGLGNDNPNLTRIAGWRYFPSFSIIFPMFSHHWCQSHWRCTLGHTTLREQDQLRSHWSREQFPPNRSSTGKNWPRWWQDMTQMTKTDIKIEEMNRNKKIKKWCHLTSLEHFKI